MTEAKQQFPENKMGTMPVGKLIFSMSVPMMISMIVQALYNIVDSIFVSMISEQALTAVSLAFPLQSLMIAFSTGIGVGINAHLSRALGEKSRARVTGRERPVTRALLCAALCADRHLSRRAVFPRADRRPRNFLLRCSLHAHCLLRLSRHLRGNYL